MKKLLIILALIPFLFSFSCSSENENKTEPLTDISQLSGQWNLAGKFKSNSTTDIATSCDLQYGKFNFSTSAVEKRGYKSTDCTEQTFTYASYSIVDGQLRLIRNNTLYVYNVDKDDSKLYMTKVSSQVSGSNIEVIPLNEQITNYYIKQ